MRTYRGCESAVCLQMSPLAQEAVCSTSQVYSDPVTTLDVYINMLCMQFMNLSESKVMNSTDA